MENNNSMKKSEIRSLVKKAINNILNEITQQATIDYDNPNVPDEVLNIDPNDKSSIENVRRNPRVKSFKLAGRKLKEMANIAITYELVPNVNPEDYSGKKRRIINAMLDAGEAMSKPAVAAALGYDKQNPINSDFMELVAQGAITPTMEQTAPRFTRPTEPEPEVEEIELADEEPGQEEFEDEMEDEMEDEVEDEYRKQNTEFDIPETEPEIGELEPVVSATGGMSDEDYQAWIKYDELKQRLTATKSNISKAKRSRKSWDDLSDDSIENEINRLIKLKNSLQSRLDTLIAGSSYLQNKIAQETEPTPSLSIEDVVDDEEQLDEWVVGKWQYYAGIKK